jgi:dienelactone hydrolase
MVIKSIVKLLVCFVFVFESGVNALAQSSPLDIWTDAVIERIRDQNTLNVQIAPRIGYSEVFYDSEVGEASWADSGPPYALHQGDTIRIHAYIATPLIGGPYPAIVIGHGHGGRGSPELAEAVAAFGYVALSIDGPRAGQSTGGPEDSEQAWISVEDAVNQPSPQYSYLYHYAYAGRRGLTLLEYLSGLRSPYPNPYRIDPNKLGVMGASMGGQFTYLINGTDARVKAAVAVAIAGDWHKLLFYPGSWLYHELYYHTRDGLRTRQDQLNTVSDVCLDPTLFTFLRSFDPISYTPRQHAPLLTIIGTHDQYFTLPAINTTYNRIASAGANPRFRKNLFFIPNGKHQGLQGEGGLESIISVVATIHSWLQYSFDGTGRPADTPSISMQVGEGQMVFKVAVTPGDRPTSAVNLHYATQIDTFPQVANDFVSIPLEQNGNEYVGRIGVGSQPPSGPPTSPENILYFASVQDSSGFTISSKMYYKTAEMDFCSDFVPKIERWPKDNLPVQPPPAPNCTCENGGTVFVPIVLSSGGLNNSFFTSEMTLTNRDSRDATVEFTYAAALGGGGGTASDTLPAGQQRIVPDAIAYLKSIGIPMPDSGSRGGTLAVRFSGLSSSSQGGVTVRTTTRVAGGRAGLAYAGVPNSTALTATSYLCGLRQNASDRTNVAVQNAGTPAEGDVVLRLTVFSGDSSSTFSQVLPEERLSPGGFKQFDQLLSSQGLSLKNGYVRIERVSGVAPYFAYAVINDQVNSDGAFVPPLAENALAGRGGLTVPVIVETTSFSSELALTNWSTVRKTLRFSYVADAIQATDNTANFSIDLGPGEQSIIPNLIQVLRDRKVNGIGPFGSSYVGPLFVTVENGDASGICIGARSSAGGGGGRYGVSYMGVPYGTAAATSAWLDGLQQNGENRTNLGLINTGEVDGNPDVFSIELFDGNTGLKVNTVEGITLNAKRGMQIGTVLAQYAPGIKQGYAQVIRTAGANPFIAYAIINDGDRPGERTGDGTFISSSP